MSCGQRRSLTFDSLLLVLPGRPSLERRGGRRAEPVAPPSRCSPCSCVQRHAACT